MKRMIIIFLLSLIVLLTITIHFPKNAMACHWEKIKGKWEYVCPAQTPETPQLWMRWL